MIDQLLSEVEYRYSRSSGPGGQNVNKVSTQVELLFCVDESLILTENQKSIISIKLKNRINAEGILSLKCGETRSQYKNKEIVGERFIELIEESLKPIKKRKPTKPSKSATERRLTDKKILSDKKKNRRLNDD